MPTESISELSGALFSGGQLPTYRLVIRNGPGQGCHRAVLRRGVKRDPKSLMENGRIEYSTVLSARISRRNRRARPTPKCTIPWSSQVQMQLNDHRLETLGLVR